ISGYRAAVRIAGVFELPGRDTNVEPQRIDAFVRQAVGYLADWRPDETTMTTWAGLRPATPDGLPRRRRLEAIATDVAEANVAGTPTCIVSSGAIALGLGSLGRSTRPRRIAELQAAAAVGQGILQRAWEAAVARHGARAGQVLLTAGDVRHRATYVNARATLETLLAWHVVPVVNENDSTATDEITFGDNDALAAQ